MREEFDLPQCPAQMNVACSLQRMTGAAAFSVNGVPENLIDAHQLEAKGEKTMKSDAQLKQDVTTELK